MDYRYQIESRGKIHSDITIKFQIEQLPPLPFYITPACNVGV